MSVVDSIAKEFKASDTKEWTDLFLKETKQTELVHRNHYLGFDFLPFYDSNSNTGNSGASATSVLSQNTPGFLINTRIETTPTINANKNVLTFLNSGISSVTFKGRIESLQDLTTLLKDVQAEYIEINFKQHYNSLQIAKWYDQWCGATKTNADKLTGTLYCDPIGLAVRNGGWQQDKENDFKSCVDTFAFVSEHFQQLNCIVVNAGVYHYAGANLTQTIAYALAHAVEYITYFKNAGIEPELVIPRITFDWPVGLHFFGEVAALRALQLAWNTVCQHLLKKDDIYKANVNAETSVFMWSAKDANTNMIRATTQAMAAMCGGAGHVFVYPFNCFTQQSDESSNRIAKNVQLLLKEESFLDKVSDPAGGSYYVESLTQQLCEKAIEAFKSIEANGGLLNSIEKGIIQQLVNTNVEQLKKEYTENKIKILGANLYQNTKEEAAYANLKFVFESLPSNGAFESLKPFVLAHHAES